MGFFALTIQGFTVILYVVNFIKDMSAQRAESEVFMTRKEAREAAFLLLFERDFSSDAPEEIMALAAEERELKISGFGKNLFLGACSHLPEIDKQLESKLIGWRGERISKVARAAMRLCVYELCYTEIEGEIAINEALELIKKFDCKESASFANGVLGAVYKSVRGAS